MKRTFGVCNWRKKILRNIFFFFSLCNEVDWKTLEGLSIGERYFRLRSNKMCVPRVHEKLLKNVDQFRSTKEPKIHSRSLTCHIFDGDSASDSRILVRYTFI